MASELMLCGEHIIGLTFNTSPIWRGGMLIDISCLLLGAVYTGVKVHKMDLWNDLDFSLYTILSVCSMVITSDKRRSPNGVSADWYVRQLNTGNWV